LPRLAVGGQRGKRNCADPIEAAESDIAHRSRHLPRKVELARLAESHGLARVQENPHRQFALLFVKLEEEALQPAIEIPVNVAKIVALDVIAEIGELDGLPPRAAPALASRRTLGAAGRQQLELLKAPEQFGVPEVVRHIPLLSGPPLPP